MGFFQSTPGCHTFDCSCAGMFSMMLNINFVFISIFCLSCADRSLPIVSVQMVPPKKPFPQMAAEVAVLERNRGMFEREHMKQLHEVFKLEMLNAKGRIKSLVETSLAPFKMQRRASAFLSKNTDGKRDCVGCGFAVKVNLLPPPPVSNLIKEKIDAMERLRSRHEMKMFQQAQQEMKALTDIVVRELEVEIVEQVKQNALPKASSFLEDARHESLHSEASVRIEPSDDIYGSISLLASKMENRRDDGENSLRRAFIDLYGKLLQAEFGMISDALHFSLSH